MSDLKLFRFTADGVTQLEGHSVALEKSLQTLMEQNLEALLGIRFLASEYSTGRKHAGRIDSLGIDENGCPVIIEYKRAVNENVINQGLYYLDWLLDHKAEFKLLVMERVGVEQAKAIDWKSCRLLCIAGGFTKFDLNAVEQINRNIELIRYTRYNQNGSDLLLLDLVNSTVENQTQTPVAPKAPKQGGSAKGATVAQLVANLDPPLSDVYESLKDGLLALGDGVKVKQTKVYIAFRRIKNFACVRPSGDRLIVWVKVDPDSITLEEGFSRDVREIGHYGTGDLELSIRSMRDLQRAQELLLRSYEAN